MLGRKRQREDQTDDRYKKRLRDSTWFVPPTASTLDLHHNDNITGLMSELEPADLACQVLHFLGPVQLVRTAALVCRQWKAQCQDDWIWRQFLLPNAPADERNAFVLFRTNPALRHPRWIGMDKVGRDYEYRQGREMIRQRFPKMTPIYKWMRLPMLTILARKWMTLDEAMLWKKRNSRCHDLEAQRLLLSEMTVEKGYIS